MEQGIELHISEVLKEERTKKGNSQEKLAEYCGVSKSAVSKWEQGISAFCGAQRPQMRFRAAALRSKTATRLMQVISC